MSRTVAHVGPRLRRAEQRQRRPVRARMLERVVQLVDVLPDRLAAADVADQPELLLVADVGEVPDQRGHQRRVLPDQVVGVDRVGELHRAGAGPLELLRHERAQALRRRVRTVGDS